MELDNSTSHSSRILIGQLKWKLPKSSKKDVKKLSQTKTLFNNGTMCSTVNKLLIQKN